MSFVDSDRIYAGGASTSPERVYVVKAGGASSLPEPSYVVVFRRKFKIVHRAYDLLQHSSLLKRGYVARSSSSNFVFNSYLILLRTLLAVIRSKQYGFQSHHVNLRLFPLGFLPQAVPATRNFTPAGYVVSRVLTMNGGASRQLMCSKPSNPQLILEYTDVPDYEAQSTIEAYDNSYGTLYGFTLPADITRGAATELLNYLQLSNSTCKWFFQDKPVVRSKSNGIVDISVVLQGRTNTQ